MLKLSINHNLKLTMKKNKSFFLTIICVMFSLNVFALETDKQADFVLDGDNFKNLPAVKDGLTKIKFWGNVVAEQGTLKIKADSLL